MNKIISILKYLIGWPLTLISLALVFKVIFSNSTILTQINSFNPLIFILSIFIFLLYFIFRSLVWKEMLDIKGHKLSIKDTLFIWGFTEIKRYVPGNIWSFISRVQNYKDKGVQTKVVFSSIILEIKLIIISCSLLSLAAVSYVIDNIFIKLAIYFVVLSVSILFILVNGFNDKFKSSNRIIKNLFPQINYVYKIKLLFFSLISFFLFGLATYLAGLSIIYLNPYYWEGYIGFFVFSLLAGYLSFVTPMGLGVREGFMTLSLSKFMNISSAGIFSIFSRIVFIISELIFLLFSYCLYKLKSKVFLRIENFITKNKYQLLLAFFIILYFTYFTLASFLRYDNFFTGRFDLGNMDQTVWNTINGRIFQLTDPNGTEIISRLAFHADFILILISPLYLIWANPKMLLILQSLIIALGSIFIYLISKNITKNIKFSFSLSLSYLLYPALLYANLYDFHAVTLSTTFLLGTYYFFMKKKYLYFVCFALLAALTKEEIWLIISFFGIGIILKEVYKNKLKSDLKKIIFGSIMFSICIFIFYALIWKIIPSFRGGTHFALTYYSDFGGSATGILTNIFLDPVKTFVTVFKIANIRYLVNLLSPVGFLSLASPITLVFALPDLGINLLSNNTQLHQIYYQYTSAITPFVFISSVYGSRYLIDKFKNLTFEKISIFILLMAFVSQYLLGPLPFTKKSNINIFYNELYYRNEISNYLKSIPKEYSIAATNNLGSHLSRREKIYTIPIGIDKADIILFLLNDPYAQPSLEAQKEMVKNLESDKQYIEVFKKEDFIVFEKRGLYKKPNPIIFEPKLFPFSITSLLKRSYKTSEIKIEQKVSENKSFTSYIISYNSDGLKLYSLMNIPKTPMPEKGYPILIINHGFINPSVYSTIYSYKTISDYFSSKGFIVLKPDYRGNGQSEIIDKSVMRFSYPIDVLNLLSSAENIKNADVNNIFVWGHSMGGEVTLKVLEIVSKNENIKYNIKAAILWAPVTDSLKWFSKQNLIKLPEARITPYPYSRTFEILGDPEKNPGVWKSISPLNYLDNINSHIFLQHGTSDESVPYEWSKDLNYQLKILNKDITFISYPDGNHNLTAYWNEAVLQDLNFYKKFLSN